MTKNKIDLGLKIAIGVLMAALAFIVVRTMQERVVEAGDSAPDFSITTDQGKRLTAADFSGKVLVLHFWASWCAPCVEEMPALNEFTRRVADAGVVVLGVSADKNKTAYDRFLKNNKVEFQTARDPDEDVSSSYGTFKFPETYIIDRHGKVYQKFPGEGDWSDALVQRVKSL